MMLQTSSPTWQIEQFIGKHHVMTLAVGSPPWCAAVFYAWFNGAFIYASCMKTRHALAASSDERAAGNIVLESRTIGRLQGLQIEGTTRRTADAEHRRAYLRRFPYAAAMQLELWIFEPTHMKLTDNRLGFGKKIEWNV